MNSTYRWLAAIPALASAVLFVRCAGTATEPFTPPRELTKSEARIVEADNTFGLGMFRAINATKRDNNIFVSPLSVSMALGMTLNGAAGATRDSMERTLALAGLTRDEINGSYRTLIDLLTGLDPKVKFQIANSIWYRQGLAVEQPFIDANREYFSAEVASLDFASAGASSTINAWVKKNTNGKIEKIVDDQIPDDLVMFLINAIYFKGSWAARFSPDSTRSEPFTIPGGTQKTVPLMYRSGSFRYFVDPQFQAVDLPYGGGAYSMTVLLPSRETSVEDLAASLTPEKWKSWTARFGNSEGELWLPRFKLAWEDSLNAILKAMGMGIAFDPVRADFTDIDRHGGLSISEVKHKTFVEVNEEGTEAAAVTSVGIVQTSLPQRFTMKIDRPFLVAIREKYSGSILFLGKIVNPS